jgi:hypothetical protein
MKTLARELNRWLGGKPARRKDEAAKDRAAFRRLATGAGLTFTKARDGYLEAPPTSGFPLGVAFAHHSWDESRARLEAILCDPSLLDAQGYYSE